MERLLRALDPAIQRFLLVRLVGRRDRADLADDLTQETLLAIASHVGSCRASSDAAVASWTYTIALQKLCEFFRRERAAKKRLAHLDVPAVNTATDHDSNADGDRLLRRVMDLATRDVPAQTIQAMILHAHHGWTWERIGALMGIPGTAARRRVERARKRISKILLGETGQLTRREREVLRRILGQ